MSSTLTRTIYSQVISFTTGSEAFLNCLREPSLQSFLVSVQDDLLQVRAIASESGQRYSRSFSRFHP